MKKYIAFIAPLLSVFAMTLVACGSAAPSEDAIQSAIITTVAPLPTDTQTPIPATDTPFPTNTPMPTETQLPTNTPIPATETPFPTNTPIPATDTPLPTNTLFPTSTPIPTETPLPTNTPIPPTLTPQPTVTPVPAQPTQPPAAPGDVKITYIFFDGVQGRNEPDEYAVITNQGGSPVNMSGWRLNADDDGQDFWFPNFDLQPGQSCKVYTNMVQPDSCGGGSFYHSGSGLWANSGECGRLYDPSGAEVSTYCY